DTGSQTSPPTPYHFGDSVSLASIYDAYKDDWESKQETEEKNKEEEKKKNAPEMDLLPKALRVRFADQPKALPQEISFHKAEFNNAANWKHSVTIIERMLSQNAYDEITQDYAYWEDASDDIRFEGALLPLWKISYGPSRNLL
ncbi:unnamed protein product, partial [Meganyctiphanes norvegica]